MPISTSTSIDDFEFSGSGDDECMDCEGHEQCSECKNCKDCDRCSCGEKEDDVMEPPSEGPDYYTDELPPEPESESEEQSVAPPTEGGYAKYRKGKGAKRGKKGKKAKRGGADEVFGGGSWKNKLGWALLIIGLIVLVGILTLYGLESGGLITWNNQANGVESYQGWGQWLGVGLGGAAFLGGGYMIMKF